MVEVINLFTEVVEPTAERQGFFERHRELVRKVAATAIGGMALLEAAVGVKEGIEFELRGMHEFAADAGNTFRSYLNKDWLPPDTAETFVLPSSSYASKKPHNAVPPMDPYDALPDSHKARRALRQNSRLAYSLFIRCVDHKIQCSLHPGNGHHAKHHGHRHHR